MTIARSAAICELQTHPEGEALCEMDSSGCLIFARCC